MILGLYYSKTIKNLNKTQISKIDNFNIKKNKNFSYFKEEMSIIDQSSDTITSSLIRKKTIRQNLGSTEKCYLKVNMFTL